MVIKFDEELQRQDLLIAGIEDRVDKLHEETTEIKADI